MRLFWYFPPLSFFLFSQSRKHANKVRLYYMLHPVDGGCPAKKLRADNVSPPVQHWAPSCCMSPHGVGNHWQTCTHPSTARQSHTPTLTLNGFSAPPLPTPVWPPPLPPIAPQKGWQINSGATFLHQWTMRQWQRCGLTHWTPHCEVSGPPSPPLSCKSGVHDVFDSRNYVACRSLFDKCSAGDVCWLVWFFFFLCSL